MSVKKDESGRRWVEVEVEVPGTPEEVWQAIATGPGISSWFVPTEFREDGTVVSDFGPGMESVAKVTAWDPPRRFSAESPGDLGPGGPPVASEWVVEARSGDTCVVRVVHSLFASTDGWDNQLESWEGGWPWFFRILRLYLTHFRSQPCSAFRVMGAAPEPASAAWDALTAALGLESVVEGRVSASGGATPLAGTVDQARRGEGDHAFLLRLEEPAPGIASLFALPMGGQVFLVIDFFFYGDGAAAAAARAESPWSVWMNERFP
jgi:uncharacterized protein YndB with AHSA1/START domain